MGIYEHSLAGNSKFRICKIKVVWLSVYRSVQRYNSLSMSCPDIYRGTFPIVRYHKLERVPGQARDDLERSDFILNSFYQQFHL